MEWSQNIWGASEAPESLATASAAKTAVASCRVSTMRIPTFSQATRMGEMCPPTRVKTYFTPWARSTAATLSPPCLGLFTSAWTKVKHGMSQQIVNPWQVSHSVGKVVKENKGGSAINCCQCELEADLKVTSPAIYLVSSDLSQQWCVLTPWGIEQLLYDKTIRLLKVSGNGDQLSVHTRKLAKQWT